MFHKIRRIISAMSFRKILEWREGKRIEKEMRLQALQNEKDRIRNLMDEIMSYGNEIRRELEVFSKNPTELLRARQWFHVKQRMVAKNWNQLINDEVEMACWQSYFIYIDFNRQPYKTLTYNCQVQVDDWFEHANSITEEIICYLEDLKVENERRKRCCFSCFRSS